jgi:putative cell wall-binding protein
VAAVKRARIILAVSAVTALLAVGGTHAASAAPTQSSATSQVADATATATVTVKVQYRPTAGATPVKLSTNTEVAVSFWRLDEAAGYYIEQANGTWSEGGPEEVDTSAPLESGTYSIRFLAYDTAIGGQWWAGKRYFYESADVVLADGQSFDLGTVVLEPRTFDVDRVSGANRYETAVSASQSTIYTGPANVVYLADGANYPDALAAGPAAIAQGGVLLLTTTTSLPTSTRDELLRLDPLRVVVVGGVGAVSEAVVKSVKSLLPGVPVDRLGGASRFATGELIVEDAFATTGANVAIVATGLNYPDALAAGPAAGYIGAPVILVDGRGGIPASTQDLMRSLGITEAVVLGGPAVVSTAVEADLAGIVGAGSVFRIAGTSRYDTAAQLNAAVFGPSDHAFVASGANFPDALAGAPLAGAFGAPLYLSRPDCLSPEADAGIMASRANGVVLLGGPGALSTKVEQLGTC